MIRIITFSLLIAVAISSGYCQERIARNIDSAVAPNQFTNHVQMYSRIYSNPGKDTLLRTTLYNVNADPLKDSIVDGVLDDFAYNYCNCVDADDARKAGNTGESLSILTNDTLLVIERRHTIIANDTIFLHFTEARIQPYRFSFDAQNLGSISNAFLEDAYTNNKTFIKLDGNTSINFTVENIAGSFAPDRFKIVFNALKVLPVTFTSVKAYQKDKNIDVAWKIENEFNIKQYEVERSTDGKAFTTLTFSKPLNNKGVSAAYTVTDTKPMTGNNYYRIRSININGAISYSTVVKISIGTMQEDINIYPNPITDGQIHLQFLNEAAGSYNIRLINNLGQVIMEKKLSREEGNNTELIKWDFNLSHGMYQLEVTKPDKTVKNIKVLY